MRKPALEETLFNMSLARIERRRRLFKAAREISSWVSASLSELEQGHDGAYAAVAEEFLAALHGLKDSD